MSFLERKVRLSFFYADTLRVNSQKRQKNWGGGAIKRIILSILDGSISNCIPTTSERMQLDFYSVALPGGPFLNKSFSSVFTYHCRDRV